MSLGKVTGLSTANSCCCQWDASLGRVTIVVAILLLKKRTKWGAVVIVWIEIYCKRAVLLSAGGMEKTVESREAVGRLVIEAVAATPILNLFSAVAS